MAIEANRECIAYLKKYHKVDKRSELAQLETANTNFQEIQKQISDVRSRIAAPMKIAAQVSPPVHRSLCTEW
jgi:hypothetical protein